MGEAAWTTEVIEVVQAGVCVERKGGELSDFHGWSLQLALSSHCCIDHMPFGGWCHGNSRSHCELHSIGPAE